MYKWQMDTSTVDRKATYLNWLLTGPYYAKEIRVFDLGATLIQRFRGLRAGLRREKVGLAARYAFGEWAAETGAALAVFGSLAFVAFRTVQGVITLGDMVMFYQAFQRGQAYLRDMLSGLAGLYEDNLFLTKFYEFVDLAPRVAGPLEPRPVPKPIRQGIVFHNVGFRYPSGEGMVLEDIDPDHPAGAGRGPGRRKRIGQDDPRQAPLPPLRPHVGEDHPRRRRPAPVRCRRAAP